MLSAQRKEFDEKKKDVGPYPRDFTRWYALDYFRRPRNLKACRFYVTLTTALVVTMASIASVMPDLHRVHQAAPVSTAHAMFNQNCANCHDRSFQPVLRLFGCPETASVSDRRCNECHRGAPHHAGQSHEAACATCHHEHRGHEVLATHVANHHCTECHRDLPGHLKPDATTAFPTTITDFNRDHPDFRPSLKGAKDQAKLRFNHQSHLALDLDALRKIDPQNGPRDLKGLGAKLACVNCHPMDAEQKYPQPIQYDQHCARCHALNVGLIGAFAPDLRAAVRAFGSTPLPHREPAVVRAVLLDRLVDFAQRNNVVGVKTTPTPPRPLPWNPVTREQWSWAKSHAKPAEERLFLNHQKPKAEALTCSQCHFEKERTDGLPSYHPTAIPRRWYAHSVFNHGSHRMTACADCHDRNAAQIKVADSQTAEDILLPTMQTCKECHTGSGGARNTCVECHRYHER